MQCRGGLGCVGLCRDGAGGGGSAERFVGAQKGAAENYALPPHAYFVRVWQAGLGWAGVGWAGLAAVALLGCAGWAVLCLAVLCWAMLAVPRENDLVRAQSRNRDWIVIGFCVNRKS